MNHTAQSACMSLRRDLSRGKIAAQVERSRCLSNRLSAHQMCLLNTRFHRCERPFACYPREHF